MMAKSVIKQLNYYLDLRFLIKFIALFLVLYYVNIFFVQLTLPGKWHNDFFVEHFNYIGWLTGSLTHTANLITHTLGLDTIVESNDTLALAQGPRVVVRWQCIGLGIISFWLAFILAQDMRLKRKIFLGLGGVLVVYELLQDRAVGLCPRSKPQAMEKKAYPYRRYQSPRPF